MPPSVGKAGVDKFKSCVSATMRRCKGSSGSSYTALAHAQREKRKKPTNGYSKIQATETPRRCALLRSCYCCCCQRCAKIRPRRVFTPRHAHIHVHQFMVIGCSSSLIAGIAAAATYDLLLLRINYGNFCNSELHAAACGPYT